MEKHYPYYVQNLLGKMRFSCGVCDESVYVAAQLEITASPKLQNLLSEHFQEKHAGELSYPQDHASEELITPCSFTSAHGPHQWFEWIKANGIRKAKTYNCSGLGGSKSNTESEVLATFTGEQLEYFSKQLLASVKSAHEERIMKSLTPAQKAFIENFTSKAWAAAIKGPND